ncbi:Tat pathway signal protein [Capnocytophaga sp. HP1101]
MTLATLKSNSQNPDFVALITAATQAPSGHNSQPWFFTVESNHIVITPDFTKSLPAVDGKHRELFMSLGCALENLCLKATELHYRTQVQLTSEGVITVLLQKREDVTPNSLAAVIPKRQTNRSAYDGKTIDAELLKSLVNKSTEGLSGNIYTFQKGSPLFAELTEYVMQGNAVQMADPAFKNELLSWIRFNKKHSESTHDGLSYAVLGAPNLPRWVTEPIVKGSLKADKQNKTDLKKIESSSDMVLITSEKDNIPTWINTGRLLQRFLLTLTEAGIANAYLNQPCEVPELRAQLQKSLPIEGAYPQIILRIGYAKPVAYSKRKDIKEVSKFKK